MLMQDALEKAMDTLKKAGISSYKIDSEVIMMFVLKIDKIKLLTSNHILDEISLDKFFNKIYERSKFKPISYITNIAYFMDYEFYVNENVLIPRSDTEILIETATDYINKNNYTSIMDIGTGSGCIPISLSLLTNCTSFAIDISINALEVAKINAKKYNLNDTITFIHSDLFENVNNKVDVLISNPPYINKNDMSSLMADVINYEPYNALYGGIDGLDFYKKIVDKSFDYINNNGMLFFEIGYDQGFLVKKLMCNKGFKEVQIKKDYKGFDRIVFGKKLY